MTCDHGDDGHQFDAYGTLREGNKVALMMTPPNKVKDLLGEDSAGFSYERETLVVCFPF